MATSDTTACCAGAPGTEDVCSLPPDALQDRSEMLRREVFPHVTHRERLANGWALEFAHTPAMRRKLEDFVAFERECCGGLTWDLTRPSDDVLRVNIQGLPPDSDFFRALDRAADPPATGRLGRLLGAVGLGTGAALFACCVVPLGIAAVASAALATRVARLDDPLMILTASAALAVPAWHWLKRRDARSLANVSKADSSGCC